MGTIILLVAIIYIVVRLAGESYENSRPVTKTGDDLLREMIERKFSPESQTKARQFYGVEYPWEKESEK